MAHAQFETIHPFADGNGRVGRCLIHVILRRRGLAARYVPPISLVLAGNSKAYIKGLNDFRTAHLPEWCGLFGAAARTAARGAGRFTERIAAKQRSWVEAAGNPRRDSARLALIHALPSHPILDVKTAEEISGASNEAARIAMNELEACGVLHRVNVGKRNRAWEAVGLFELLNEFERELATPPGRSRPGRPAPR
ncbi:MAG: Fic family protein [Thermoanaerobaculia bacterium]